MVGPGDAGMRRFVSYLYVCVVFVFSKFILLLSKIRLAKCCLYRTYAHFLSAHSLSQQLVTAITPNIIRDTNAEGLY